MSVKISPVDVSTLQERVYQELRAALFQGRLVPGETVTIRALARALGTSEMPVREALQRLVAEKVLQQTPGRSIQVVPLTRERFDELTRIRMTIEGLATAMATRHADEALFAELRQHNQDMRAALAANDHTGTLQGNQEFHFAIYRAARSPQLLEIIETLWLRSGPFLAAAFTVMQHPDIVFERGTEVHDRIIAAMVAQKPKAAARLLALDIRVAAAWYRRNYRFLPSS